jgi:hypothetical protein
VAQLGFSLGVVKIVTKEEKDRKLFSKSLIMADTSRAALHCTALALGHYYWEDHVAE